MLRQLVVETISLRLVLLNHEHIGQHLLQLKVGADEEVLRVEKRKHGGRLESWKAGKLRRHKGELVGLVCVFWSSTIRCIKGVTRDIFFQFLI